MPTHTSTDPDILALTGLHLFHATLSNSSMRVRLLLEEKGLEWTSHVLDASRQDNLSEAYLRINPTSLIPSLVHDGRVVTETNDILYHIDALSPDPRLAPDAGPDQDAMRAWVDRAASSHPTTLKPWMYAVTGAKTKRPEDMARYRQIQSDAALVAFHQRSLDGFSEEEVADAVRRNHAILQEMEDALQKTPWLVGDRYTLADVAWFPNVLILHLLGFPTAPYPAVRQWLEAIQRRPACGPRVRQGVFRLPRWAVRLAVGLRKTLRG